MKKVLLTIVSTVIALILFAQIDDELNEQASDLINRLESAGTSESYLYLYGFFAKEGESPKQIGETLFKEYQQSVNDKSYRFIDYPESDKLPQPKGKAFCLLWEQGCLAYLFSAEIDSNALASKHNTLMLRSNTFLAFSEFKTLSKPTSSEIYPPYHYISAAERIKVLESISVYQHGNAQQALASLLEQFSTLRKSMALQDNLIGKLIFLIKLSEIIDVASVILSNTNIAVEEIAGLTASEKSFYMIAAREFGLLYYEFKNQDKHPEFFNSGGNFPGWITRMIFKPNMTINAIAPKYYKLEQLAQLSPSDFAKHIHSPDKTKPSTSALRNYAGDVLADISPEFDKYLARFFDFDAKLALFNQHYHLKLTPDAMVNPYYGKEKPQVSGDRICFSGPLEDNRFLRCLSLLPNSTHLHDFSK